MKEQIIDEEKKLPDEDKQVSDDDTSGNDSENNEKKKNKKIKNILKLPKKKLLLFGAIIILLVVLLFIYFQFVSGKKAEVKTISKSSLTKVLEINDLSTLNFIYNGIAEVKNDDGETKYHVSYKGNVNAGIDFKKIDISVDNDNKKIVVTLPDAVVQSVSVDMGTMKFIFEDEDDETETVTEEAYKASCEALEKQAKSETDLLEMA